MEKIKFYSYDEVHQEIKSLCKRNANCTDGTKFYVFKIKDKNVYTVDATLKNLKHSDILELYESDLKRLKMVNRVINDIPEIEIVYDEWDYVDNVHIGSFKNDTFEIEIGQFLVIIDLKVEEKSKESGGYSSDDPLEIDKLNHKIRIGDIKIENEESEELEITDQEYEKLRNAIIDNILI